MIETRTLSGLHVITDVEAPTRSPNSRTLLEALPLVIAESPTLIQVRLTNGSDNQLRELGEQVIDMAGEIPVIFNNDVIGAKLQGAAGAHVGPRDMSPEEARDILGPDAILGVSVYNLKQAEQVMESDAAINYVGIGPVNVTRSGPQGMKSLGLEGVEMFRRALPGKTLIVLGGIKRRRTETNGSPVYTASEVMAAGADGVGVIGDIFRDPNPGTATRELVRFTRRVR